MNETTGEPTAGDREVQGLLQLYAERRLRPDAASAARLRATLMAQTAMAAPVAPVTVLSPGARWGQRRRIGAAVLGAAAVLVLASGALAATGPGGPLYDLRLWVEEAMAPADPASHAVAEIEQLDQRIDEVVAAIGGGDAGAASAALRAYDDELDDAVLAGEADPGSLEAIEARVRAHLAVLEGILDEAPEAALPGLRRAIENSSRVLERLQEVQPGKPSDAPGKPSDAPGKPSDAPGKPSDAPGKPSDAPGKPSTVP
jgi:hypothetical protein